MSIERKTWGDVWGVAAWAMFGAAIIWVACCVYQMGSSSGGSDYMLATLKTWVGNGIMGCIVATLIGVLCVGVSAALHRPLSMTTRWALGLNGIVFAVLTAFVIWPD
jgi:hypothetical protein